MLYLMSSKVWDKVKLLCFCPTLRYVGEQLMILLMIFLSHLNAKLLNCYQGWKKCLIVQLKKKKKIHIMLVNTETFSPSRCLWSCEKVQWCTSPPYTSDSTQTLVPVERQSQVWGEALHMLKEQSSSHHVSSRKQACLHVQLINE